MSFFSIIVPIYNAERFLERTLDSAVSQKFHDYEVILVNDGSTDGSEKICRKFTEKYSNFTLINKDNSGVSETRNVGIANAKGKYIIFLDADDLLAKDALGIMAKSIKENNEPDIVIGNHRKRYLDRIENEKDIKEGFFEHNDRSFERNIIDYYLVEANSGVLRAVWAKAFSAKLIADNGIRFNSDLRVGEDMVFLLECAVNCKNYLILNEYIYEYFINSSSVMNSMEWKGFNTNIRYLTEVNKLNKKYGLGFDLTAVWFEISEREWLLLDRSSENFTKRYSAFKSIMNDKYYREYSAKKHNAGKFGKYYAAYAFCIRRRLVLPFMALVSSKNLKWALKDFLLKLKKRVK